MSALRAVGPRGVGLRVLVEHVPPLLVAAVLAPWIIAHGVAWPWRPDTIDLDVYRMAGFAVLHGDDLYAVRTPGWNLPFIYPPIAALLLTPTALLPRGVLQAGWLVLNVAALCLVLRRAGIRRGWTLGVVAALLVAAFEPLRTTLGYGQINLLLMALVAADLLPDRPGDAQHHGRHWLPRGVLLGLAAAIKLTPLLFVVYAVGTRRWRTALATVATFAGLTALAAAIMPGTSLRFLHKVLANDLYGDPRYIGNQSLVAAIHRLAGWTPAVDRAALAVGAVTAVVATLCAVRLFERNAGVLAVGTIGVATCLASPISWTHHYVWALLVLVGALAPAGLRVPAWLRGAYAGWAGWVALCPVLALGNADPPVVAPGSPAHLALGLVGPLWAAALVAATLVWFLAPSRRTPTRARPGASPAGRRGPSGSRMMGGGARPGRAG